MQIHPVGIFLLYKREPPKQEQQDSSFRCNNYKHNDGGKKGLGANIHPLVLLKFSRGFWLAALRDGARTHPRSFFFSGGTQPYNQDCMNGTNLHETGVRQMGRAEREEEGRGRGQREGEEEEEEEKVWLLKKREGRGGKQTQG